MNEESDDEIFKNITLAKDDLQVFVRLYGNEGKGVNERLEFSDALFPTIVNFPKGAEVPRFEGVVSGENDISVTAANLYSREWLVKEAPKLKLKSGKKAVAYLLRDLPPPRYRKLSVWFPSSSPCALGSQQILAALERQNAGLHSSIWDVLSRKEELNGVLLTVLVDESCFRCLEKLEFLPYFNAVRASAVIISSSEE